MSAAGNYRAKAVELLARAETENNQTVRAEFENLAEAFLRVAVQAEHDAAFPAETELPSPKPRLGPSGSVRPSDLNQTAGAGVSL